MKKKLTIIVMMVFLLQPILSIADLTVHAFNSSGTGSSSGGGGGGSSSGGGGGSSGGGGGGVVTPPTEDGGDKETDSEGGGDNITNITINNYYLGKEETMFAYNLVSLQGLEHSTYVPKLNKVLESQYLFEKEYADFFVNSYFTDKYKRDYLIKDYKNIDVEYAEAINWLYKNNLIHNFESLSMTAEGGYNGNGTIAISEDDEVWYPYTDRFNKIDKDILKKNFIMQLIKVLNGVEESRPLLYYTKYLHLDEYAGFSTSEVTQDILMTKFRQQAGASGIDWVINDITIDFEKYGSHYYYVNPNVYELYLRKALDYGIINYTELSNKGFLDAHEKETNSNAEPFLTYKYFALWNNLLPDVRIGHRDSISNNKEYSVLTDTNIFGYSWSTGGEKFLNSNTSRTQNIQYVKGIEYFTNEKVSYIDAVKYIYKAINAYSDEKLPEREVQALVSMYSVNYGQLTADERKALNYLIAKGIIDGDDSAKWTSPESISTKDAIIALYRVANKDARLTFKLNYSNIDQEMLKQGFVQSQISIKEYNQELPQMEVNSTESVVYNVVVSDKMKRLGYKLGNMGYNPIEDKVKQSTRKMKGKELNVYGMNLPNDQEFEVWTYEVPWDLSLRWIGMTLPYQSLTNPYWIDFEIGGGYYYINDSALDTTGKVYSTRYTGKDVYEFSDIEIGNEDTSMATPQSKLLTEQQTQVLASGSYKNEYANKEKYDSVFIGVNTSAVENLLFDNVKLFSKESSGKVTINKGLVKNSDGYDNIAIITNPTGQASDKIFVEFRFPVSVLRNAEELKNLVKRRLTLNAEGVAQNEDIASYTGLKNGQTLISIKELKRLGIEVETNSPDILYYPKTSTYAYINTEDDYALISNTIVTYPSDSLMIEVSEGEVYYNMRVVMSLINEEDFYVFNDEGGLEVVRKLENIKIEDLYDKEHYNKVDKTYTATIKNKAVTEVNYGKYFNITALSGNSVPFYLSFNKTKENPYKRIYSFEGYYSYNKTNGNGMKTGNIVEDLLSKPLDVIEIENILINNAIARNELGLNKDETFSYADNVIKITSLVDSSEFNVYANEVLNIIESIVKNLSENDIQANIETLDATNNVINKSTFKLDDLLTYNNFVSKNTDLFGKLMNGQKSDTKNTGFWVLYFLNKFNLEISNISTNSLEDLNKAILTEFNNRYTLPGKVELKNVDSLKILDNTYAYQTNVKEKRTIKLYRVAKTSTGGYITSDALLFVNANDSVYMKLYDEGSASLKNVEKVLGAKIYNKNNRLTLEIEDVYRTLPKGKIPLESLNIGDTFDMVTSNGKEKFVVINNMYNIAKQNEKYATIKIARVKLKPFNETKVKGDNLTEKYYNYYSATDYYKNLKNTLGNFKNAVYSGTTGLEFTINKAEIMRSLVDSTETYPIYFEDSRMKPYSMFTIPVDLTKTLTGVSLIDAYPKHLQTRTLNTKDFTIFTKLIFDKNYTYNKSANGKGSLTELPKSNYATGTTASRFSSVYESFLINYGTIAINNEGTAELYIRSNNSLTTMPVMTDVVNSLVLAIIKDRVGKEETTIKDLKEGDLIKVKNPTGTVKELTLAKTSESSDYKGYYNFMVNSRNENINYNELMDGNSLLLRNYSLLDSFKLTVNQQKVSLYNFVGNLNLNIANPKEIEKFAKAVQTVNSSALYLSETRGEDSKVQSVSLDNQGKILSKKNVDATNDLYYKYFLSLELDEDLVVRKNKEGYYEIVGYNGSNLINSKAFLNRASKFDKLKNNTLSLLPTFNSINEALMKFEVTEINIKDFKKIFTLEFWDNLLSNGVINIEKILSVIGIYYLYALGVLVTLTRTVSTEWFTWLVNPVKLMTFGLVDPYELNLVKFYTSWFFALVLLVMTENGLIRLLISKGDVVITSIWNAIITLL